MRVIEFLRSGSPVMARIRGPFLGLIVLIAAGGIAAALIMTKKTPNRAPFPQTAPIVELAGLTKEAHSIEVIGFGNVRPVEEVSLRPQVAGMIVETGAALKPGGRVQAGDVLVRIDPRDYDFTVQSRQAQVAEAQASLALEQGRQSVAKAEWDMISKRLDSAVEPPRN